MIKIKQSVTCGSFEKLPLVPTIRAGDGTIDLKPDKKNTKEAPKASATAPRKNHHTAD
jgi:hypothetical protein